MSIHRWEAEDYHLNSSIQMKAALSLLDELHLRGNEMILDVGCGDGKITAEIASRVKNGSAVGIDLSPEMIRFAQERFPSRTNSNLTFLAQNAEQLSVRGPFDVIFSSFALQWVANFEVFMNGVRKIVKPNGSLAWTIPLGISEALEDAIQDVSNSISWKSYFAQFSPGWHFREIEEYQKFVEAYRFQLRHFQVVSMKTKFSSRKSFEQYVKPWMTYLKPLPDHLKNLFFQDLIGKYLIKEPASTDGAISFEFQRLDLIGQSIP
jgi:trans-aconitate methyltransferase